MTTAFVFAGGGSLGAIQVGMLRALVEHGLRPDFTVGSSVGAINAAYFAWSPDEQGVKGLEAIWREIRRPTIFPFSLGRSFRAALSLAESFTSPANLRDMLTRNLPYQRLEETRIPLHAVATDALSGSVVPLSKGPAIDALLASAAIPGLFPAVDWEGRRLIDGGVASNTPISVAAALGATRIVVLPAGYSCALREPPRSPLATIGNALNHVVTRHLVSDLDHYGPSLDLRVVPALCPIPVASSDFSRTQDLMRRGAESTRLWLTQGGLDGRVPLQLGSHRH